MEMELREVKWLVEIAEVVNGRAGAESRAPGPLIPFPQHLLLMMESHLLFTEGKMCEKNNQRRYQSLSKIFMKDFIQILGESPLSSALKNQKGWWIMPKRTVPQKIETAMQCHTCASAYILWWERMAWERKIKDSFIVSWISNTLW